MKREISRKELFRGVFSALREARERTTATVPTNPDRLLRPPGALSPDADYLAACTGCEQCVPACPHGSIFMTTLRGDLPRRVAVLLAERKPCYLCDDLPCVATCPDGALRRPESRRQVHLGVAQVDPRACRTFRGEACDLCVRFCPFPDEAIRMVNGRPVVMAQGCTGCGLCVAACPERPKAIVVIAERHLIPGVRLPLFPFGSAHSG